MDSLLDNRLNAAWAAIRRRSACGLVSSFSLSSLRLRSSSMLISGTSDSTSPTFCSPSSIGGAAKSLLWGMAPGDIVPMLRASGEDSARRSTGLALPREAAGFPLFLLAGDKLFKCASRTSICD